MPKELAAMVPTNNATLLNEFYQNIYSVVLYPKGDPIRDGVIAAYENVMFRQVLAATCVAIFPPIFCFFLTKPIRLEDVQNLKDGKDVAGNKTGITDRSEDEQSK